MVPNWTNNLSSEEDKEKFKKSLYASRHVLARLQQLLDQEEAGLTSAELNPKIYDSPNWDYKQAHGNGFRSALRLVNKLINLDPKDNK